MLRKVNYVTSRAAGGHFAIVASRYNPVYVEAMVKAANATFKGAKAAARIFRVPGAYEIPIVAARLARSGNFSGIVCLGVILRGETVHAQHIGDSVSRGLLQIQLETEVPVIHEVLLLENRDQARVRCMDKQHNRGREAAQTALQMAEVMRGLISETLPF